MDRGAWRATGHGISKSWTRLSGWAHTHTTRILICLDKIYKSYSCFLCIICSLCVCMYLGLHNIITWVWIFPTSVRMLNIYIIASILMVLSFFNSWFLFFIWSSPKSHLLGWNSFLEDISDSKLPVPPMCHLKCSYKLQIWLCQSSRQIWGKLIS